MPLNNVSSSAAKVTACCAILCHFFSVLSFPSPSHAEEDALTCPAPIQADCLLEMAEEQASDVQDVEAASHIWQQIAEGYVRLRQPALGWSSARHIRTPARQAEALTQVAALYRHQGEQHKAKALLQQAMQALQPLQCSAALAGRFHVGLGAAINGLDQVTNRLPSPIREAALALTIQRQYETTGKSLLAHHLSGLSIPHWHDVALTAQLQIQAASMDETALQQAESRFKTHEARQEWQQQHLPLALQKAGQSARALEYAHQIPTLETKAATFRLMVADYLSRGEVTNALHLAEFARDFANQIPEGYARSAALRFTAELYWKLEKINAARAIFQQALAAALSMSNLERKVSAVIGVVEMQRTVGDDKGTRQTVFDAFAKGLLKEIDNSNHSGELGRLLGNLDERLSLNDRARLIGQITTLNSPAVREKMIYKLAELRPSPHIQSESAESHLQQVADQVERFHDVVHRAKLRAMFAAVQAELENKKAALNAFADLRGDIEHLGAIDLPAAALAETIEHLTLFLAREEARVGEIMLAMQDARRVKNPKKQDALNLARTLAERNQWLPVTELLLPDAAFMLAADTQQMDALLDVIKKMRTDKQKRLWLWKGFQALVEDKQWSALQPVMQAIVQFDEQQWSDSDKLLASPSPGARKAMFTAALHQQKWDEAYQQWQHMEATPAEKLALLTNLALRMTTDETAEHAEATSSPTPDEALWLQQPVPPALAIAACSAQ